MQETDRARVTIVSAEDGIAASALARYFVEKVERVRDTLSACRLSRYADEVCIVLPRSAKDFGRFVTWTETMFDTFAKWSAREDVRAVHDEITLLSAHEALYKLTTDAQALQARYLQAEAIKAGRAGRV